MEMAAYLAIIILMSIVVFIMYVISSGGLTILSIRYASLSMLLGIGGSDLYAFFTGQFVLMNHPLAISFYIWGILGPIFALVAGSLPTIINSVALPVIGWIFVIAIVAASLTVIVFYIIVFIMMLIGGIFGTLVAMIIGGSGGALATAFVNKRQKKIREHCELVDGKYVCDFDE
jgi:hypothetical protein